MVGLGPRSAIERAEIGNSRPTVVRACALLDLLKCARDHPITPTGKPPPLAVRLEQALPFRRCVGGENVSWGTPASQATPKPQVQRVERRTVSTRYHGKPEKRESGSRMLLGLKRNVPSSPPSGGILPQYPPLGGYPQTTRSAGGR